MTQSSFFIRYLLVAFMTFGYCTVAYGQVTQAPQSFNVDSLRTEVLRLGVKLDATRANLKTSHRKFRSGILVSGIGYSITIIGGSVARQ